MNLLLTSIAFSPVLSTLQQAVRKGHLLTWSGIEHINFEKSYVKLSLLQKAI